ncbi:MAG: Bug family tripartite tricarboxylate transporter substrate binding protein [Burkholderiales bacterium]
MLIPSMMRAVFSGMLVVAAVSVEAAGDSYPEKPIRVIVPSSPGGPADVIARAIGDPYSRALGQTLVFDNRAGAAGSIGAALAARAPADGYTLLLTHSGPLVTDPFLNPNPSYDVRKDFVPITLVGATPLLLVVNPRVAAKSVRELVGLAKKNSGKLIYASGGNGTAIHLTMELFKSAAGINVLHVPYKGAGPGLTALLGGEVDMMVNGLSSARPQMEAGRVRALANTAAKRSPLIPNMPTIMESGIQVDVSGWYSLLAPAGTPKPVIAKLQRALATAVNSSEANAKLAGLGIDGIGSTSEELTRHIRIELAKWEKAIKSIGLKPIGH